jgi:DNA-binding beta-propeller fold protein YncE
MNRVSKALAKVWRRPGNHRDHPKVMGPGGFALILTAGLLSAALACGGGGGNSGTTSSGSSGSGGTGGGSGSTATAPSIASFTASQPSVGPTGSVTFTASFSTDTGGSASIDHSVGAVTSGEASGAVTPGSSTTYTLTVTNSAGTAVTAKTRVLAGDLTVLAGVASGIGNTDGTLVAGVSGARFYKPSSVAVDGSGNIYVADQQNNTIRLITSGGTVTTIAGTPGIDGSSDTPALFDVPSGVAVDTAGNIYVADTSNGSIRKIAASPSYAVSTVVPSHTFLSPVAVAVDNTSATTTSGNLYVADGAVVFQIRNGSVTSLAGSTGSTIPRTYSAPSALAVDGSGTVYAADGPARVVHVIHVALGTENDLAMPTSPSTLFLTNPSAVAVDASHVYVGDSGDNTHAHTVYQITGGTTWTSLGTFQAPAGLALNSTGTVLYEVDAGYYTVNKIVVYPVPTAPTLLAGLQGSTGHTYSPTAGSTLLNEPWGLAVDSHGNTYVADSDNNDIAVISAAGTVTELPGAAGAGLSQPAAVALDPTGTYLYVADAFNHRILMFTIADGTFSILASTGTDAAWTFNFPIGLGVDPRTGVVYVADNQNSAIRKIVPPASGNGPATSVTTFVSTGISDPTGVAVDASGNIYETDRGTNRILDITTGTAVPFAGSGLVGSADGLGSAASFHFLFGLAADPDGNLFVVDNINNALRMITPAGLVSTVLGVLPTSAAPATGIIGTGALPAHLAYPWGVAIDLAGNPVVSAADAVLHLTTP